LIKLKAVLIIFFVFAGVFYFTDCVSGKTFITGDEMEIKDKGELTVLKGNSKVVKDEDAIVSDKIIYNKNKSSVSASGNVGFLTKTKNNEVIEIRGNFADYNMKKGAGKLWGNVVLRYFMRNLAAPVILCAQEIYIDKDMRTLKAYGNVELTTSDGKVYSDNIVFSQEKPCAVFKKDKKRPTVYVFHSGNKSVYEADEIVFYNFDKNKKITMNGSVSAKIEVEDKEDDTKN